MLYTREKILRRGVPNDHEVSCRAMNLPRLRCCACYGAPDEKIFLKYSSNTPLNYVTANHAGTTIVEESRSPQLHTIDLALANESANHQFRGLIFSKLRAGALLGEGLWLEQ